MDAVEPFRRKFRKFLIDNGYSDASIYNTDETGVLYVDCAAVIATTSLVRLNATTEEGNAVEDRAGTKLVKDRVTVSLTAKADGSHKLKPLVIGKSQNPRCFKNVNRSALSCTYMSQKKA